MSAEVDDPPTLPPPVALGAVAANAVMVGASGAAAPMAWLLVPAMVGVLSRPRKAWLVSVWALALIGVSVFVPFVPGHDPNPWALGTSLFCLVLPPGLARVRFRGMFGRWPTPAGTFPASPRSWPVTMPARRRWRGRGCRARSQWSFSSPMGRCACCSAWSPDRCPSRWLRDRLERTFGDLAAGALADLPQLAAVLGDLVRRSAPDGYVAAALVQIDREGAAQVLSCGGPPPLAVPVGGEPSAAGQRMEGSGCDGPPLGLGGAAGRPHRLPDDCRVAVVTNAFALAHYADYSSATADDLRGSSLELAAVRLLQGVARPSRILPGLEAAPVVGPALVIGPRRLRP